MGYILIGILAGLAAFIVALLAGVTVGMALVVYVIVGVAAASLAVCYKDLVLKKGWNNADYETNRNTS